MRTRSLYSLSLILALILLVVLPSHVSAGKPADVNVQILAVNDFHGALDPSLTKPTSSNQATWYYRGGAGVPRQLRQRRRCNKSQYRQGIRRRHDRGQPVALIDLPR